MKQEIIGKYKQKIAKKNMDAKPFEVLMSSFAKRGHYQDAANCQEHIKRASVLNSNYELFISYLVSDRLDMIDHFSSEIEMLDEQVESLKTDLAKSLDLKDYANAHKYRARINSLQELSRVLAEFVDDMGKLIDSKKQKET